MFRFPFYEWLEKMWREVTPLNYCERQGLVINKNRFYIYLGLTFLGGAIIAGGIIGLLETYSKDNPLMVALVGVLFIVSSSYIAQKVTLKKDDLFIKWLTTNGKHR